MHIICNINVTPTFLYFVLSDGVLGFMPLAFFTQLVFQMFLFEIIQTYSNGHAT